VGHSQPGECLTKLTGSAYFTFMKTFLLVLAICVFGTMHYRARQDAAAERGKAEAAEERTKEAEAKAAMAQAAARAATANAPTAAPTVTSGASHSGHWVVSTGPNGTMQARELKPGVSYTQSIGGGAGGPAPTPEPSAWDRAQQARRFH